MNENNPIKLAFPAHEATIFDRDDAMTAATNRAAILHRKQIRRGTFLFAAVTYLTICGGFFLGPKAFAFYRFQQITNSVTDCKTAVMESFSIQEDGSVKADRKTIFSNGNWRLERLGHINIYADKTLWTYEPSLQRVTRQSKPDGPFGYNPSGFSIKSMVADYNRWGWRGTKTSLNSEVFEGKQSDVLTLEQDDFPSRTRVYADPKTHMPFRMTSEVKMDGEWRLRSYATYTFDHPVEPKLFSTTFPGNPRIVNIDTLKADWAKKLETPIATIATATTKIVIRDYFINERGHIFLIYTDGETVAERDKYAQSMRQSTPPSHFHRPANFLVNDSSGVNYRKSDRFQPYTNPVRNLGTWISLKDGEVLQGAWLVPMNPQPWQPKTLTFTGRLYIDPYKDEDTTTWTIKVDKPSKGLLPDWSPACAMTPFTAEEVIKEEADIHHAGETTAIDPQKGIITKGKK